MKTPTALLYDTELTDGQLRCWQVLANYQWQTGGPFEMPATQLAVLLGRSKDQAERRTRELEDRGLLLVERNRGHGRPNRYSVPEEPQIYGSSSRTSAAASSRMDAAASSRRNAAPYCTSQREEERTDLRGGPVDNSPAPADAECEHGMEVGLTRVGLPRCPLCRSRQSPAPF